MTALSARWPFRWVEKDGMDYIMALMLCNASVLASLTRIW